MKKIIAIILLVSAATVLVISNTMNSGPKLRKEYKEYLEHKKPSKKMASQKKQRLKGGAKYDCPDMFAEYFKQISTAPGKSKPDYAPGYRELELKRAHERLAKMPKPKTLMDMEWTERGPSNVGGRTRAIVVDPTDPTFQTWFAGSVAGGIWKTTDMGDSWNCITPDFSNMATSTLVMAKSNPDILYSGTGEGFNNIDLVRGSGIYKSTDHGESWNVLTGTENFQNINRIIVDPDDPDLVLCCCNTIMVMRDEDAHYVNNIYSAIMRSTDGGQNWETAYKDSSNIVQQLVPDPSDFDIQYATLNSIGVLKSTDRGQTWVNSSNGIGSVDRIEMDVSPVNPSRIFLSAEHDNGSELYMSVDAGATWTITKESESKTRNWLSGQGWYDNTIMCHPYIENRVYVGGIYVFAVDVEDEVDSSYVFNKIRENGTRDFMDFASVGLSLSGMGLGREIWEDVELDEEEYISVEIRFGPEISQNAHRFTTADMENFDYQDYVELPLQAYEMGTEKQLNVAFLDVNQNGQYDFADVEDYCEYLLVYTTDYDESPNTDIMEIGPNHKNMYVIAPIWRGGDIDRENLPESNLQLIMEKSVHKYRESYVIIDPYYRYNGANSHVHSDHHALVPFITDDANQEFMIVNGNDGGVAYSLDEGASWVETDYASGYNTSQFYGCDKMQGADRYIGGTQDNGTYLSAEGEDASLTTEYSEVISGDGFYASWHYSNPDKLIGGSQFNDFMRSTDRGNTWQSATSGLSDKGSENGIFLSQIAKSQIDPELLFAVGKTGVWRSANFGASWTSIPIADSLWANGEYFGTAKASISLADPHIVWAGVNMGIDGSVLVSTDYGKSFEPVSKYNDVDLGHLSGFATHPTEPNTAYALFSMSALPKVLRTTDLGQTWDDISGFEGNEVSDNGFPDVLVYCLLVMPHNPEIIWVGAEIGIFESTDSGENWHILDGGLPKVSVWEMRTVDDQVVVATHGRGIWTATVPGLADFELPEVTLYPIIQKAGQTLSGRIIIEADIRSDYDRLDIYRDSILVKSIENIQKGTTELVVDNNLAGSGQVEIYLKSYKDDIEYESGAMNAFIYPLFGNELTYLNDFEESDEGLICQSYSFRIRSEEGFEGQALHTKHDYINNRTYRSILQTPIVVAETGAEIEYDDIAIIEPGEDDAEFGKGDFYDYVAVYGTKDGINWVPLADGYDASLTEEWLEVYENYGTPTPDMFYHHKIDLHDTFEPLDTILISFVIYADGNTNGWGWVVDNLEIQKDGWISVDNNPSEPEFSITNVYPNPVSSLSEIGFYMPYSSQVSLRVFDINGNILDEIENTFLSAGSHSTSWNFDRYPAGSYYITMQAGLHMHTVAVVRKP